MGSLGIITRSRTTGYLPFATEASWWPVDPHRRLTRVEAATLVARGRGGGAVEFFLSGIPSSRVDHVGTPIRYSVFGVADDPVEWGALAEVLRRWCGDADRGATLGRWLDATIGDSVEAFMEGDLDRESAPPFLEVLTQAWPPPGRTPRSERRGRAGVGGGGDRPPRRGRHRRCVLRRHDRVGSWRSGAAQPRRRGGVRHHGDRSVRGAVAGCIAVPRGKKKTAGCWSVAIAGSPLAVAVIAVVTGLVSLLVP